MREPGAIRLSQFINHSPSDVWRALTDPSIHAKWWAAGDVRAVVGHRFTLDMGQWGQQPCEVVASPLGKRAFEGMSAGWPKVLERLAPTIDARAAV